MIAFSRLLLSLPKRESLHVRAALNSDIAQ